ncbi:MAG: hypothetical protein Q8Q01_00160 [archaeon]|nr:hypothetical protein [archaeon]
MKRGSIGLSVNILVVVIISLVILGLGVNLLYQFIGGATEIQGHLDQRTEEELEHLLTDQGKRVALPLHTANVLPGESHTFGIGILNIGEEKQDYFIAIDEVNYIDDDGIVKKFPQGVLDEWILYNDQKLNVEPADNRKEPILVSVPENAPRGQYIFKAKVCTLQPVRQDCTDDNQYGNTQQFTVVIQ